ncbi:hypothetical protein HN008_05305 [Vibrio parahaemolyticus]|nr:hypothetical protein Vp2S01_2517 [Vibrio parahaemolyticus]KFE95995.1 hypothetical protein HB39_05275 [Vibrio parahaemolyticus]MBE4098155.1 hypothetical protein [Vibrio parahaemolyticus]MBE4132710.1 hypothetical protein [Vibrio parahaemolyticus]MBE4475240.1 hypothetical protein [Vibrio parahaemolyticus]
MVMNILIQPWKGLKPQDKVIYIRWLLLANGQGYNQCSIALLAEKLMMKASMVRASVTRLCLNEYVARSKEGGRYVIAQPEIGDKNLELSEAKKSYIKQLLGEGEDLCCVRAENISKRLLKAVLVALSDDIGVINMISFAQLVRITGMTEQRLRRYRDELINSGFILKFISGCNAPTLYKKACSICIIDPKGFGSGKIYVRDYLTQDCFSYNPLHAIKNGIKAWVFGVEPQRRGEVARHNIDARLYHMFDELISQKIRNTLGKDYKITKRKFSVLTDDPKLNREIAKSLRDHVNEYSIPICNIIPTLIPEASESQELDIYCFQRKQSMIILLNLPLKVRGRLVLSHSEEKLIEFESNDLKVDIQGFVPRFLDS